MVNYRRLSAEKNAGENKINRNSIKKLLQYSYEMLNNFDLISVRANLILYGSIKKYNATACCNSFYH